MRRPQIISTAYMYGSSIYRDELNILNSQEEELIDFCRDLYRQSGIKYPKFHKMDILSKIALLMAEQIIPIDSDKREALDATNQGIFIANRSSSLYTDELYVERTFAASGPISNPALFVYTLPNIMLGELAIRFGLKGEQAMWISDHFDAELMTKYVLSLFRSDQIDACLIGWIDFEEGKVRSFLSWIEITIGDHGISEELTVDALQKKYRKISVWNK